MSPEPLPTRRYWRPAGALPSAGTHYQIPQIGQVVTFLWAREAWRVVKINDVHPAQWDEQTVTAWEKRDRPDQETWEGREVRIGCEPARNPAPNRKDRRGMLIFPWAFQEQWWPLYEPWPECVECAQVWPCPCKDRNDEATRAMADLDRLAAILPGCCWACAKPITGRQHLIEFPGENLLLPGADPVVFHTAGSHHSRGGAPCRTAAERYEQRWIAADPTRRVRLVCDGTEFRHFDSYECSAGEWCPGSNATHRNATYCSTAYGIQLPDGTAMWVRPSLRCDSKGCRGGAA